MDLIRQQLLDLLDRSGAKLYAMLTRLTLCQDVADDLLQELFIKLDRAARTETVHDWESYARQAAIHLAFDWWRRQKRAGPSLDAVPTPACDELSPLGRLVRDEQIQEILARIGQLNGSARQAFVLRYIEQESYESIAASMNKTPHQVRALCAKVMQWLRNQMGESDAPCPRKDPDHAAQQ
ncbi:MAG: sigma-70 family RNA polymerase sigma factor [Phycisphaerae bacterium]|nr:sigma-70 family RNA polymerase sigma factor [Phycisphaerae bacterium]